MIPDVVSPKSVALAKKFLGMLEPPVELSDELTVKAVVSWTMTFQAMVAQFENEPIDSLDGMQLVRVNSTHGERAKEMAQKHVAQVFAERITKVVVARVVREGDAEDTAYFKRPNCLQELRWAREVGVPIQPVIHCDDKRRIGIFLGQAPEDLKDLGKIDFMALDNISPAIWKTCIDEVIKSVERLVGLQTSPKHLEPEPELEDGTIPVEPEAEDGAMPEPEPTINAPGHWDAMISYTQKNAEAKLLATEIYTSMRERGKSVWLDIRMDQLNEAAMKEAAQQSKCIIAVVTGEPEPEP